MTAVDALGSIRWSEAQLGDVALDVDDNLISFCTGVTPRVS